MMVNILKRNIPDFNDFQLADFAFSRRQGAVVDTSELDMQDSAVKARALWRNGVVE